MQRDEQRTTRDEPVDTLTTRKIVIRKLDRIETTAACGESGH